VCESMLSRFSVSYQSVAAIDMPGELLVSLVVVENRFFGIGAQIFLSQLPYNERSLNSQRLSIPPVTRLSAVKLV
jgi:hypothetical protein